MIAASPDPTPAELFGLMAPEEGTLRAIFAMTANGATELGQSSHGIGNALDSALFNYARQWADCILVGAETVRKENYFGVRTSPEMQKARLKLNQTAVPPIAVVSASLNLDPRSQFFTDAFTPPIILSSPESRECFSSRAHTLSNAGAHIEVTGTQPTELLVTLRRMGFKKILLEGGPSLFHQFFAHDLIDVTYVTIAPMLAPVLALPRATYSEGTSWCSPTAVELASATRTQDGYLFLRYQRPR